MPIVSDGQLNLAALQVDDLYVVIIPPQTPLIPGFPTDGIGFVGTSIKGPLNTPVLVGTPQDVVRQFGDITTHPNDLVTELLGAMKQGSSNIYASRTSDGTAASATGVAFDPAGIVAADELIVATAISPGTWANAVGALQNPSGGVNVFIDVGSAGGPTIGNIVNAAATDTVTIAHAAGNWVTGSTVTVTIAGQSFTYNVGAGDLAAGAAGSAAVDQSIASNIAASINAGVGVFFPARSLTVATVSGAVITLTTKLKGYLANITTLAVTNSVGAANTVAGGATFSGGTGGGISPLMQTTLSATLANAAVTATVVSTAAFPTAGYLIIGTEVIQYTGTTATTFTGLTRGALGSTQPATTYAIGTVIGGAMAGMTYKVTVTSAYDPTEVFDSLSGAEGAGTVFGTVASAMINAINNGIAGIRGPSAIITAAAGGTSTSVLNTQLIQLGNIALLGTQGADGRGTLASPGASPVIGVPTWTNTITTAALIGVDGLTGRTGIYALRGLPIFQMGVAGLVDPTSWSLQLAFAISENLVTVLGVAQGTSSQTAVANKQPSGIDDYHALMVKDFLFLNDTQNKLIRLVSPIGPTLGRIAALSPERSPGNKPIFGYLGTERTGYVAAGGAFRPGTPYSSAEIGLLEQNGILFMTLPAVGGGYLALRHGQNSSSDPTRNGINYSRMVLFIARSLSASPSNTSGPLGFVVNEVHTAALRRRVISAISQFLGSLSDPGPGRAQMIGDVTGGPAFSIVCDSTNNPPSLVAQGYLYVSVQVKLLSIVRFFILNIEAGQSVTVKVSQSPIARPQQAAA